jgi:hypothetical protein
MGNIRLKSEWAQNSHAYTEIQEVSKDNSPEIDPKLM